MTKTSTNQQLSRKPSPPPGEPGGRPEDDTGTDWPAGIPGVDETEDRPNFYEEIGVKGRGTSGQQMEKVKNEPPKATMVDKSGADQHQAEGPGGKG